MSVNCRLLRRMTDGKTYYYYRNSGVRPPVAVLFDKFDDMPKYIRDCFNFNILEVQDVGPDFAWYLGVRNEFYPDFPNCGHPGYPNTRCIAERCRYAPDNDWTKCPYFKN